VIKAKLHEITGMPAGKQKLQLGVSTVGSDFKFSTLFLIQSLFSSLGESVRIFPEMISNSILVQFIGKIKLGEVVISPGAENVAERNKKTIL